MDKGVSVIHGTRYIESLPLGYGITIRDSRNAKLLLEEEISAPKVWRMSMESTISVRTWAVSS